MRRSFWFASFGLFALVLVSYGGGFWRYFTSEDFLLVRFLGEHPPWRDPGLWTGPWLGVTVVKFYRPVSTLIYGAEIAAFGASPFGYNLVHTLVHALNAVMVLAIVRRLAPGIFTSLTVAALFAIYPLHPNAVLFGASFATAILSLLLAAYDLLLGRRTRRWPWWLPLLPFFAVLGLYLVARRAIFGVFIGGYDDFRERMLDLQWTVRLSDLATSIQKLHAPVFDRWPTLFESLVFAGFVTVVPFVFLAFAPRRAGAGPLRLWLFAWAWILVTQIPFAFRPSVPGNGRFWYVTAAGVALAAALVVREVAAMVPERERFVRAVALGSIALYWGWLFVGYLKVYVDAGRTAQAIQAELIREHPAAGAPPRIFVTRYPYFIVNPAGVPVAQVFHYGLRDAVNPPFVAASVPVYPLPPLSDVELRPVFAADPRAMILEWDAAARQLRRAAAPAASPATEITVLAPADGAVLDPRTLEVQVAAGDFRRFGLIVVAHGNATTHDPVPTRHPGGAVSLALPTEFVTTMARLYPGGEFHWWLVARDDSGAFAGFTRMRSFRLGTTAPRP